MLLRDFVLDQDRVIGVGISAGEFDCDESDSLTGPNQALGLAFLGFKYFINP